jgi:anti-anti-sigma regulatory factor
VIHPFWQVKCAASELRFTGEIDFRNASAVTASVAAALNAGADLHLDLSAAEFCDASGIDALFLAAASLPSGRLVLHGLPSLIQTAIMAVVDGRSRELAISVSDGHSE